MIFPSSLTESLIISVVIGFGVVVLIFLLQNAAAYISAQLEKHTWSVLKILFEDCYFYVAAFGAVNIWRGIWGLCDRFILPDQFAISNWICHIIGGFGCMLL